MSNILSHVIGGPCDKQVIPFDDGRDVIYMCPPIVASMVWRPDDEPSRPDVSNYRYKLTYFTVGRTRPVVWGAYVWDGMSNRDAEAAIASRYL